MVSLNNVSHSKEAGKTTCRVAKQLVVWQSKKNSKHMVFTSTKAAYLHDTEVVRKYTRNLVIIGGANYAGFLFRGSHILIYGLL